MSQTDEMTRVEVDVDLEKKVPCLLFIGAPCENEAEWICETVCCKTSATACSPHRRAFMDYLLQLLLRFAIVGRTPICSSCESPSYAGVTWRHL